MIERAMPHQPSVMLGVADSRGWGRAIAPVWPRRTAHESGVRDVAPV